MELSEATGLERHKGCRNGLADGEVGRINLPEHATSAGHILGRVLKGAVDVRAVPREGASRSVRDIPGADRPVENVRVWSGDIVEDRRVHAEVLGEDMARSVGNPIVNHESRAASVESSKYGYMVGENIMGQDMKH